MTLRLKATTRWAFVALLFTSACGPSNDSVSSGADADASTDGSADGMTAGDAASEIETNGGDKAFAEALFDPTKLIEVEIELPKEDWDALRHQKRGLDNFLEPDCRSKPFESEFTYRKATVTVNGVELQDVGVRKKGFVGSITSFKPSLKLKFNKFVKGQFLHGVERMTLNNNRQDAAFLRTCLAYRQFNKGGVAAPRCSFARVRVNGQELGLYSHVESVKRRFLTRVFGDNSGALYEGTLSDFREGWTETLEPKTSDTPPVHEDMAKLVAALGLPDGELLPALEELIDLPQFLRFWAMEVLVNHFDGYNGNSNNFYMYRTPSSGLWSFIPWGTDATFQDGSFDGAKAPSAVLVRSRLARRLYEHDEGQKLYLAALKEALAGAWDEEDIEAYMTKMRALVGDLANDDPLAKLQDTWFDLYYNNMLGWVKTRRKRIEAVLSKPPVWPFPPPEMLCFTPTVQTKGTFKTTFDTLEQNAFNVGSASFSGTNQGAPFNIPFAGASSGFNKENPNRVEVRMIFQHPAQKTLLIVVALTVHKSQLELGKTLPLNHLFSGQGGGLMATYDTVSKQTALVGALWKGTITFTAGATTNGAEVSGTFDTDWIAFGAGAKK